MGHRKSGGVGRGRNIQVGRRMPKNNVPGKSDITEIKQNHFATILKTHLKIVKCILKNNIQNKITWPHPRQKTVIPKSQMSLWMLL